MANRYDGFLWTDGMRESGCMFSITTTDSRPTGFRLGRLRKEIFHSLFAVPRELRSIHLCAKFFYHVSISLTIFLLKLNIERNYFALALLFALSNSYWMLPIQKSSEIEVWPEFILEPMLTTLLIMPIGHAPLSLSLSLHLFATGFQHPTMHLWTAQLWSELVIFGHNLLLMATFFLALSKPFSTLPSGNGRRLGSVADN